jgi:hypothetical protein
VQENAAKKNRSAFGDLTNQDDQGNVPGRGTEKVGNGPSLAKSQTCHLEICIRKLPLSILLRASER